MPLSGIGDMGTNTRLHGVTITLREIECCSIAMPALDICSRHWHLKESSSGEHSLLTSTAVRSLWYAAFGTVSLTVGEGESCLRSAAASSSDHDTGGDSVQRSRALVSEQRAVNALLLADGRKATRRRQLMWWTPPCLLFRALDMELTGG